MRTILTFVNLTLPGCIEIQGQVRSDHRGSFTKVFHRDLFESQGLEVDFAEDYFTVSSKRVLRGLHFQAPPHEHAKIVFCVQGKVLDVIVDIRKGSPTYQQVYSTELRGDLGRALYLPPGIAHGFYVSDGPAILVYKVSSIYSLQHDCGLRWDSISFSWPDDIPIVSDRDDKFPCLKDFNSPFEYRPTFE